MFIADHSGLALDADHLDLSFRDTSRWLQSPSGERSRFLAFKIGDATAGPQVILSRPYPSEAQLATWHDAVDPPHSHGSDQFRALAIGDWTLANRPMPLASYAFQEAGWVYNERPGEQLPPALLLVYADRRGAQSTLRFPKHSDTLIQFSREVGMPEPAAAYPHPAGPLGIAAVATTAGACEEGYRFGRFDDLPPDGAVTGLLGDVDAGPVVHLLRGEPNTPVLPSCRIDTELLLLVIRGSCRIGEQDYQQGDLRLQRAGAALPPVLGGAHGLDAVLLVGSRNAAWQAEAAPGWMRDADALRGELAPRPGGAAAYRASRRMATA